MTKYGLALACAISIVSMPVLADKNKSGMKVKQVYGYESTEVMNTPTGVVIDGEQNIYVAETASSYIKKYDRDGNFIAIIGERGNEPGQLNAPVEMYIKNSTLYVGEVGAGRISRFTLDGQFIDNVGADDLEGPRSVAVDDAGQMYALDEFSNRIVTFSADGEKIAECASPYLFFPNDIEYNNGNLYVANASAHNILKFDTDCNLLASAGGYGTGDAQFFYPRTISVNGDSVYVSDVLNNRIQVLDLDFNYQSQIGGSGILSGPIGFAITADNDYVIVDSNTYSLKMFDQSDLTTPYKTVGAPRIEEGMFAQSAGVAFDKSEKELYITDISNHRVQVFNSKNGEFKRTVGQLGFGAVPGDLIAPLGVSVIGDKVYVASSTHQIVIFDKQGTEINRVGSYGAANGQFYYPYDVKQDSKGNFYVTEHYNNRMQKFDSEWNHLATIGGFGSGDGNMYFPTRLYIDKQDRIFVADTFNNRVQVFNSETGEFIAKFGAYGQAEGSLFLPYALTMDKKEEYIILGESGNNRISVFKNDADFTFVKTYSKLGATDEDSFFPSALDQCGSRFEFCMTNRMQNNAKRFKLQIKKFDK